MPGEVSEVVRTLARGEQRPAGRCPSERERRGRFKGRRDRCRMDAQRGRVAPDGLLPTVFARAHRAQTLDQDLVLVKLEHDVRQPPALLALERVAVGSRLVAAWPERGGEERRGEGGRVLLEGLGDGWWEADWVGGEGGTSAERGGKAGEQAGGVSSGARGLRRLVAWLELLTCAGERTAKSSSPSRTRGRGQRACASKPTRPRGQRTTRGPRHASTHLRSAS